MAAGEQTTCLGARESWSGNCLIWLGGAALPEPIQADLRRAFGMESGRVIPVPLAHLDHATLDALSPRGILSTLYWRGGDVIDAAETLVLLGYRGPYRALSPPLPDVGVILREVSSLWPELDFAILEMPAVQSLRRNGTH